MQIVETVLGNSREESWRSRLAMAHIDWLHLDHWEAQKNRFRKRTEAGGEVAVSLDRGVHLQDGDVLAWDPERLSAIVARIELKDVMVIRIDPNQEQGTLVRTCIELGHAIGNQHWPAVVKDAQVFVPLVVDRQVMASVMKTHDFAGITYHFAPGSEVIPYLAPHEERRLFGSPDQPVHSHTHAHEHDHVHASAEVSGQS